MLSVQRYQARVQNPSFKANPECNVNSSNEKPYYQSNIGLKVGTVYALGASAWALSSSAVLQTISKRIEKKPLISVPFMQEMTNGLFKSVLKYLPIFIPVTIGCGAIVDKVINDKNKQLAKQLEIQDKKTVLTNNKNADITKDNNVYYRSQIGKTIGPILGAIATPALGAIFTVLSKEKYSGLQLIKGIVYGVCGGFGLGAITDSKVNRAAAKFADQA